MRGGRRTPRAALVVQGGRGEGQHVEHGEHPGRPRAAAAGHAPARGAPPRVRLQQGEAAAAGKKPQRVYLVWLWFLEPGL